MREVGRYAAESGEWGVVGATAAGNTAFVVENGVLVTIDVSTPSTPVVLDRNFYLPMFGSLQEVVVKDGRAYVCSGAGGLTIFDVSDPSHLRMLGRTSNVSAEGVHVIGSTAYVAGVDLSIVDVAAPSEPRVLWRSGMGGGSQDVRVSDGLAYVANGPAGLTLFDVRDPATARELFALPFADGGWQIALAEHIAYVARGFDGLGVYETVDLEHTAYLPYAGSTDARRSAPPSRAGCPVYDAVPSALLSRASHPARGGCSGGSG